MGVFFIHNRKKGFTLVELIVVLAIMAILGSMLVPTLLGFIDKARSAQDIVNVRAAKQASLARYLSDGPGEKKTYYYDAANETVKTSRDGISGYGISSEEVTGASGIPRKNGQAHIVSVTVSPDGSCSATWGTEIDDFLAKAISTEASYKGYHSGEDLISAVGTLPSVAVSTIFGTQKLQNEPTTLYWRPLVVTFGGVKTVILYANSSPTGNASWQAFAFYYNDQIYRSKNHGGYQGRIDPNATPTITDLNILAANKKESTIWELAS